MDERVMFWGALLVAGGGRDSRKGQEVEEKVMRVGECVVYNEGRKDSRKGPGIEDKRLNEGVVDTQHFPEGSAR